MIFLCMIIHILIFLRTIRSQAWEQIQPPANEKPTWISAKGSKDVWIVTESGKIFWRDANDLKSNWIDRSIIVKNQLVKATRISQSYVPNVAWAIADGDAHIWNQFGWARVRGRKLTEIAGYNNVAAYGLLINFTNPANVSQIFQISTSNGTKTKFMRLPLPPTNPLVQNLNSPNNRVSSISVDLVQNVYVTASNIMYKWPTRSGAVPLTWLSLGNHPSDFSNLDAKQIDAFNSSMIVASSYYVAGSDAENQKIENRNKLYKWNRKNSTFVPLDGTANEISVSGDKIYCSTNYGQLYVSKWV